MSTALPSSPRPPLHRPPRLSEGDDKLADLHAFVLETGRALTLAGAAVNDIQDRLEAICAAFGVAHARVVALPTLLIVSFGRGDWATVEPVPGLSGTLRLDQIAALYELVDEAERGAVDPREGLRRLELISSAPPRHGIVVSVLGCAALTVGLCLVLRPTPSDLVITGVLGALVGLFVALARGRQGLTALVPVLSAAAVAAVTFEAVGHGDADPGLRTLIAPLVIFLPGAALTTATIELASGEMVAGATRLVSGGVQLTLLAFGIVAGVELAGLPSDQVLQDESANLLGWWAPWLGVLVFGVAASIYFSAPRGALPWLLLVLLVAWVGQVLGDQFVGSDVSGFFGALAATPVALAIGSRPGLPPAQVTWLPAFWLLVPGALGLIGVTEVVGNPASASIEDLVRPIGAIVAIALGVLGGVSVYNALAGATRRRPV